MANCWRNNFSCTNISVLLKNSGGYEKIFTTSFFLYVLNEIVLKDRYRLFNNHFNDLLAIPLLLSYSGFLIKRKGKTMNTKFVIGLTIVSSFVWEYITPYYLKKSTGDWLDVLAYFIGLLIFLVLERSKK